MIRNNILEVRDLAVVLDGESIISQVSFDVGRGEMLVIIGPNGAGKTVLFRALLGLVAHKGMIKWREGVRIGYIPQKLHLDRTVPITVREFFLLKSKRFWLPAAEFISHIKNELELVGLSAAILSKPVSELSGGQFQRIMVAWALVDHPDVLLFDEPTTGVDIGSEETIYNLILRLQKERETTVLVISHDLHVVYRYASHVLCLNKQMMCFGVPSEVLSSKQLAKLYSEPGFYKHGAHHP